MPFVIGVAGSSGSGKTTVSEQLAKHYAGRCVVISADNYYLGRSQMKVSSFDHPGAIDFDLLVEHIKELKAGRSIEMPGYDFSVSGRKMETTHVEPQDVIIVEGILVLHCEELRQLMNVAIFVDTDIDTCRDRRLSRDVKERGRTHEHALAQWNTDVLPAYKEFVEPSRDHATIVVENSIESQSLEFDISPVTTDLESRMMAKESSVLGRRTYGLFPMAHPVSHTPVSSTNHVDHTY